MPINFQKILSGVSIAPGTAANPTITFVSSANAGFFLKALNNIGVATSGVEVGSVDANGLWTLGAAGGTQTHVANGTLSISVASFVASFNDWTQITTPSNPASGNNRIYFKSDNKLYKLTSGGTESEVGGSSGMTNPMTTTGDVIYSSSNSGTPARLGIGPEASVLTVFNGLPIWLAAPNNPGRGLFDGGYSPTVATIDYITIDTTSNTSNFGDLTIARPGASGVSTSTRGVFCGGGASEINTMDYVTIATTGNATDFGDLLQGTRTQGACSNSTRGVMGGGTIDSGAMEYITIATTGNSTSFGNLSGTKTEIAAVSNSTRGVFSARTTTNMDYVTIATTGNATNFGSMTNSSYGQAGVCSRTRGVFACADAGSNMEYIEIATTGNSTQFGTLNAARNELGGASNSVRGVFAGGGFQSMDYITIASTGNATNFGNLSASRQYNSGLSDSHGGL